MTVLVPQRRILKSQLSIPRLNFRRLGDPAFNRLGVRGQPWGLGRAGAAAAAFSPSDIAGLELWLKADEIGGLNDSDPVATWSDESGNDNDFAQAIAGDRPLYRTNIQNGLPSVQWVSDDQLNNASISLVLGPLTLFIAFNPDGVAGTFQYLMDIQTGRTIFAHLIDIGGRTGWFDGAFENIAAATANAQIMTWNVEAAGGEMFRDGTSLGAAAYTELAVGGIVGLGNANSGSGANVAGHMFEVILYDTALSAMDQDSVELYMGNKWGITIS